MKGGIFCYRKEAPEIVDFLYFALRNSIKRRYDSSCKLIVDLMAGSGCLSELVARALVIEGTYAALTQVVLCDKHPWPKATLFLGLRLLQAMPRIHGIRLRFEPLDEKHADLAEALNERVSNFSRELLGQHSEYMSSSTLSFDLFLLQSLMQQGLVKIKIADARDLIEELSRKSSNLGRLPAIWVLDPPRHEASKSYYKEGREAVPEILKRLYERKAAPVVYVDRVTARKELEPSRRRVLGYYRLYVQGKAGKSVPAFMWVMIPESAMGEIVEIDKDELPNPKEIEYKKREIFVEDPEREMFKRLKRRYHVRQKHGIQKRFKRLKLPERDFMYSRPGLDKFLS